MSDVRKCTECGRIIKEDSKTGLCPPCLRKSIRDKAVGGSIIVGGIVMAIKNPEAFESVLDTLDKIPKK